jgi:hypothetical protein
MLGVVSGVVSSHGAATGISLGSVVQLLLVLLLGKPCCNGGLGVHGCNSDLGQTKRYLCKICVSKSDHADM